MAALGLVRDLLFRSRIDGAAEAAGVEVGYTSSLATVVQRCAELKPTVVIVDLSEPGFPPKETLDAITAGAPGARVVGFASHVSAKSMAAAREAGFDLVLSRSQFVTQLPQLLSAPGPAQG